MQEAKNKADLAGLKLVIIDDQSAPPQFKLMKGSELYQLQMKAKDESRVEKESSNKPMKEKEVEINLGISDHDLDTKLKMINNFYTKGHSIKIILRSQIFQKQVFIHLFLLQICKH